MTTETRATPTTDTLAKIDAWMQRLADETDQAAQSAELTRYLTTLSRFYTCSAPTPPASPATAPGKPWAARSRRARKASPSCAPRPLRARPTPATTP